MIQALTAWDLENLKFQHREKKPLLAFIWPACIKQNKHIIHTSQIKFGFSSSIYEKNIEWCFKMGSSINLLFLSLLKALGKKTAFARWSCYVYLFSYCSANVNICCHTTAHRENNNANVNLVKKRSIITDKQLTEIASALCLCKISSEVRAFHTTLTTLR